MIRNAETLLKQKKIFSFLNAAKLIDSFDLFERVNVTFKFQWNFIQIKLSQNQRFTEFLVL